jgi:hypothetical protein
MRPIAILSCLGLGLVASALACSGSPNQSGFSGGSGGSGGGSNSSGGGSNSSGGGSSSGNSSGSGSGSFGNSSSSGGSSDAGGDAIVTVKTTIYAHSDDTLYSVDPTTNAVTEIGPIAGADAEGGPGTMTDCAVDANGDVYLNSESAVYKATLPSSTPGTVNITQVASLPSGTYFYALAFAPVGALDANNETLVGGDSKGDLYYINTSSGAITNLGGFGNDASNACGTGPCVFELSGDIVFYNDAMGNATGLATIRSCPSGKSSGCTADWLAGVNMANLKTAYTSGTPAATLLAGIYGGNGANLGPGTGYHDVFGLGAWNTEVFGFTRHTTSQATPMLITINTTSGAGTMVSNNFSFTNGWSGAGVTTKVTITVPPPPPPPPNNQ